MTSLNGTGRCDEGSAKSIASPKIVQDVIRRSIQHFEAISPVTIQDAVISKIDSETFTLSWLWKVSRLVLEVTTGYLVLNHTSILDADADQACKNILIGLGSFSYLWIDSCTFPKVNHSLLNETNCTAFDLLLRLVNPWAVWFKPDFITSRAVTRSFPKIPKDLVGITLKTTMSSMHFSILTISVQRKRKNHACPDGTTSILKRGQVKGIPGSHFQQLHASSGNKKPNSLLASVVLPLKCTRHTASWMQMPSLFMFCSVITPLTTVPSRPVYLN